MKSYKDYREVPKDAWPWPNFTPFEFRSRGDDGAAILIIPEFMDRLQSLRSSLGFPFIITSGFRTPAYNMVVCAMGTDDGPHTTGRAVDIAIYGERFLELTTDAFYRGFTGFGIKQHGPYGDRFIHLDDLSDAPGRPRPWPWSYK